MARPGSKQTAVPTSRRLLLNTRAQVRFFIRLAISLVFLGIAAWGAYFGVDCTAWPSCTGQVVSTGGDLAGESPFAGCDIQYSYIIGSTEYRASRVRFGDILAFDSGAEFLKSHGTNPVVKVFYNPDCPDMSCLMTGYTKLGVYIPLGIGLFFFATAGAELRARLLIR